MLVSYLLPVTKQRSLAYIFTYEYISKLSKNMHSLAVNDALDKCFLKKLMKVKNTNNSSPDGCYSSDK